MKSRREKLMMGDHLSSKYQFVPMHNWMDSLQSTFSPNTVREMWLRRKWEINVPGLLKYTVFAWEEDLPPGVGLKHFVYLYYFQSDLSIREQGREEKETFCCCNSKEPFPEWPYWALVNFCLLCSIAHTLC